MADLTYIILIIVKVAVIFVAILTGFAFITWVERKTLGHLQHRMGPAYTGPFGLLQPVADGVKLIFKEDIIPAQAERLYLMIAPIISFIPAFLAFAVIPLGNPIHIFGRTIPLTISDLNIGVLFVLATTSLGVYGIALAGWSSGSKYSLLGGIRSSAQMISYEVAYGLSLVPILMIGGTLSLTELVHQQSSVFDWYVFKNPVAFILFWICAVAETNRAPFDMPEAESELVGGYHTEYSSMRFAMFFIAEYVNMITASAVAATIFFGGWNGPILPGPHWLIAKILGFMVIYIWLRATFPRVRYDQLMSMGWKVLFPLALANVLITGIILYVI